MYKVFLWDQREDIGSLDVWYEIVGPIMHAAPLDAEEKGYLYIAEIVRIELDKTMHWSMDELGENYQACFSAPFSFIKAFDTYRDAECFVIKNLETWPIFTKKTFPLEPQ